MADLLLLVVVVAFFALAAAYLRACDRMVGSEPLAADVESDALSSAEVAS